MRLVGGAFRLASVSVPCAQHADRGKTVIRVTGPRSMYKMSIFAGTTKCSLTHRKSGQAMGRLRKSDLGDMHAVDRGRRQVSLVLF